MNFFEGLSFVIAGDNRQSHLIHRKAFKDYYGLQFLSGEELELGIDSSRWSLEGSWAFISRPGPFFHYGPQEGKLADLFFVCFRGPRVESYISSGLLPLAEDAAPMKITAEQRFRESFERILSIPDLNSGSSHDLAVNLLEGLLLQLHSQPERKVHVPPRLQTKILALSKELGERPELEWDFHSEARRLGISYVYLRTLFRQLLESPPNAFLLDSRIALASKLLITGDAPVSEVAASCGFSDEFYFSRAFKKRRHISPLLYRKEFGP